MSKKERLVHKKPFDVVRNHYGTMVTFLSTLTYYGVDDKTAEHCLDAYVSEFGFRKLEGMKDKDLRDLLEGYILGVHDADRCSEFVLSK